MKSILLRFPDKVVRYIRGGKVTANQFERIVGAILTYGYACGWSLDEQEAFRGIGWAELHAWESIKEVIVDEVP